MTNQEYNDYSKIGNYILMSSGSNFYFDNPKESNIQIEDIASALSKICRFNGFTRKFYSVAEHSLLCSYLVPAGYEYDALMHDIAEAVLGDVSTPLKRMLPDYKAIEKKIEAGLFERFDVLNPLPAEIKLADLQALAMEKRDLMPITKDIWPILEGIEVRTDYPILCMEPNLAKSMFLRRYYELVFSRY